MQRCEPANIRTERDHRTDGHGIDEARNLDARPLPQDSCNNSRPAYCFKHVPRLLRPALTACSLPPCLDGGGELTMDVRFTRCNPTASIATDCACSVPQVNAGRALRTTMHSACKIHYRQLSQIAIGNIYQQMTQGGRNVPVRMLSESIRRGCGEKGKRTRDRYPSLQGHTNP
jgi:hypothetical protein